MLYKKGLFHNIFDKTNFSTKKTLIKNCIEIYDRKTIKNNEYPILSSTKDGIKFQDDYFNKQTASENTIGYKIIPKNYITYRSMSDTGNFYFNIQNIVDTGIVSPAYPVFTVNNYINLNYFVYYLNNSKFFKNQIIISKEGGTRFALSLSKFSELEIKLPDLSIQNYYSEILNKYIAKEQHEKKKLELYTKYKNYLLQNMFI